MKENLVESENGQSLANLADARDEEMDEANDLCANQRQHKHIQLRLHHQHTAR